MATGVNVKMDVKGVSEFKKDLREAQSSVKTLDAALKLNEAQFKATGDSEAYMQEKTDLLNRKIDQQEKAVEAAKGALNRMEKDGVNKASDAYQKMQQQVLKAEADLLGTKNELNGVADAGQAAATSADRMNDQLKEIGKGVSFQNVTEGIGKITDTMEAAFKKAIQLGKAITKEVLGAGNWADDLQTRATYFGVSPEELQRMQKTASLIDTSVDAIVGSQKKLRKGLGSGDKGVSEALKALFGEGFESKNWEDTFWKAGEALMKFSDEEEKEAYAQKLFGKSWNELIPLFQAGRKEYEELNKSWSVVPQENIDKLQEMDDKYQVLQNELETVKMTFLSELAPAVSTVLDALNGAVAELNKYLESEEGQEALKTMGDTIAQLIKDLVSVDPNEVVSGLKTVIDKITEAFRWISEHHEDVKTGLEVIAGGFAALKLANVALNIGKIVSGFKTLWGGANNKIPTVPGAPTTPTTTGTGVGTAATGATGAGVASKVAAVAAKVAPAAFVAGTSAAMWFGLENNYREREWGEYNRNVTANEGKENALMEALRQGIGGEDWEETFREHAEELRALTPDNPLWDLISNFADLSDGLQSGEIDDMFANWFEYGMKGEDVTEMFKDAYNKMSETVDESNKVQDELSKNMVKPEDLKKLDKLPSSVADAVSRVGFTVELDGENVVAIINRRLGIKLAGE